MIRWILTDIEGTTTSIHFVHKVLFPYASKHLEEYVSAHATEGHVVEVLDEVVRTVQAEEGNAISTDEAVSYLLRWIKEDRKHPALKNLQGHIWRHGYEQREYAAHIYEDVAPQLREWIDQGRKLAVYSSGSIEAQQLLFGHSDYGDLRSFFSEWFDTSVGHKREAESYVNILKAIDALPEETIFLSDIEAELNAARGAGMHTCQLLREGTEESQLHPTALDFYEVHRVVRSLD